MPNRLIKDSIHESEKINALTDFQFRVWVSLITFVDDYGRGDARPAIIKGRCFPLRDEITAADIGVALRQLAAIDCIRLYEIDGMRYLYFPNWDDHQRVRTKVSKFPPPDSPDAVVCNLPQPAADCGDSPQNVPLNPNPNPNPNPNTESELKEDEEDARAREEIDMNAPWVRFVKDYEQNIGLMPTSMKELEDLQVFFDEYGQAALSEFVFYTARKHADNPHRYFAQLCRKYLGRHIDTPEKARAAFAEHDNQQKGGAANGNGGRRAAEPPRPIFGDDEII